MMHKKLAGTCRLAAILWLGCLAAVAQNNWYVATNGTGADGLSWTTAFTNIQDALNAAGGGDTIHLAGQAFGLTQQLVWPSGVADLTLRGGYAAQPGTEPGEYDVLKWPTIITRASGTTRLLYMLNATNAVIERVRFRGGYQLEGAGLYANNATGTIRDTVFENNFGPQGWALGGGAYLIGGGLTFQNVGFANNTIFTGASGWRAYGAAVYIASGTHHFTNLLVIGNETLGAGGSTLLGSGIYVANGSVAIHNATLAYNSVGPALQRAAGTLRVENSILWDNDGGDFGGSITFSNTCAAGLVAGVNGNRNDDPLFETPLFYLATNSPVLGQGNRSAVEAGVAGFTSLVGGQTYAQPAADPVNLGYHHSEGVVWDLDLYVAPGGGGDGLSETRPLGSITAALAMGAARTRIHLAAGNYLHGPETFPLNVNTRTVQLLATNPAATVISSAGSAQPVLILQNSWGANRIEGVTLTSGGAKRGLAVINATFALSDCRIVNNLETTGGGLHAARAYGRIQDTVFANNDTPIGWARGGGVYISGGGLSFDRVALTGNRARTQNVGWVARGGAVYIDTGVHRFRNILAVNNTITRSNPDATLRGSAFYIGLGRIDNQTLRSTPRVSIENATLAENTGSEAIHIHGNEGTITVRNTILWDHPSGDLFGSIDVSHSCSTQLVAGIQGNIVDPPLFVDPIAGDYRLQSRVGRASADGEWAYDAATSPCIDAGTNRAWMAGAIDLDGRPRVARGLFVPGPIRVDMGAYETHPRPRGTMLLFR